MLISGVRSSKTTNKGEYMDDQNKPVTREEKIAFLLGISCVTNYLKCGGMPEHIAMKVSEVVSDQYMPTFERDPISLRALGEELLEAIEDVAERRKEYKEVVEKYTN